MTDLFRAHFTSFYIHSLGRVDFLSFFDYLSPFYFLLIEFHCTFSISYKIQQYYVYYYCILLLLLLLLKKVGSARLRESDVHPISPKTPAPQYQPIDRKKRKGKIVEDYSRDRAA